MCFVANINPGHSPQLISHTPLLIPLLRLSLSNFLSLHCGESKNSLSLSLSCIRNSSAMLAQKQTSSDILEEDSRQRLHNQQQQQPPGVKEEEEDEEAVEEQEKGEEEEEEGEGEDEEEEEEEKEEEKGDDDEEGDGDEEEAEGENSDGSPSSSDGKDGTDHGYVSVNLAEIRKEVQCPICLGIIRKTRTVMECLHRFCRECIDKSMRMGNNECPACRTHCASRRSLRDDPRYDALIAALYPDIDKYEEEEMAFHEEEKTRNKQIQASIAQTVRRQSEALVKRRTTAKTTASAFIRKSRRGRGRNSRGTEMQGSDDDEDGNGNEGGRESSSADESCINFKQKRQKRWPGPRLSQPSSADVNADGGCDENVDSEVSRDNAGVSPGFIGTPEVLAWGKGGVRSHTRYGSLSGSNGKIARSNRLSKLVDHLRSMEENDSELDVHLTLAPLDEQKLRSLEQPYLCCRPTLSVRHLCQFIALQTSVQAEDIEILVVKEPLFTTDDECGLAPNPSIATNYLVPKIDPSKDNLQILDPEETLAELQEYCTASRGHLVLAYKQKVPS